MTILNKIHGPSDIQDKFFNAQDLKLKLSISDINDSAFIHEKLFKYSFSQNSYIEFDFLKGKVIVYGDLVNKIFMGVAEYKLSTLSTNRYQPKYLLLDESGQLGEMECIVKMKVITFINLRTKWLFALEKNSFTVGRM